MEYASAPRPLRPAAVNTTGHLLYSLKKLCEARGLRAQSPVTYRAASQLTCLNRAGARSLYSFLNRAGASRREMRQSWHRPYFILSAGAGAAAQGRRSDRRSVSGSNTAEREREESK